MLNVIFDEIFYSALPNRQMRINDSESLVTVQTRERDLTVISGIEDDHPCIVSKIKGVPGDMIIDFKPFDHMKVVCLTKNGFLSCYDVSQQEATLLSVKRMFFEDRESPNSLEVSTGSNKICVASLRFEDNIMTKKSPKKNGADAGLQIMFKYNCINVYILEYNFKENSFDEKFDKPFRIESDLNETPYPIEMNMKHTYNNNPILFMILNKS